MDKINILVVANHPKILGTILRLINGNELWYGVGAESAEEAVTTFERITFEMVLFGVGIDEETVKKLLETFQSVNPNVICIRHFGGGSGLLYSEIQHALTSVK